MKKLLISIFLTTVSMTAFGNDAADFSTSYPALYQEIDWQASHAIDSAKFADNFMTKVIEQEKEDEFTRELAKTNNQHLSCLNAFNPNQIKKMLINNVQAKLSSEELSTLNQYYSSDIGKFEVDYLHGLLEAFNSADEEKLNKLSNDSNSKTIEAKSKQIDKFHKSHSAIFEKMDSAIQAKEIKDKISEYKESCKSE